MLRVLLDALQKDVLAVTRDLDLHVELQFRNRLRITEVNRLREAAREEECRRRSRHRSAALRFLRERLRFHRSIRLLCGFEARGSAAHTVVLLRRELVSDGGLSPHIVVINEPDGA